MNPSSDPKQTTAPQDSRKAEIPALRTWIAARAVATRILGSRRRRAVLIIVALAALWSAGEYRISRFDVDDAVAATEFAKRHNFFFHRFRRWTDAPLRNWAERAAFRALTRLTEEGDPAAALHLGHMYRFGQTAEYEPTLEGHWALVSAQRGYLPAYGVVSEHHGWRTLDERQKWAFRAAERGQIDALAEFSSTWLYNSEAVSARWHQAALDRGSSRALFQEANGKAHEARLGDMGSLREAVSLYEQAAVAGSFDATRILLEIRAGIASRTEREALRRAEVIDIAEAYRRALIFVAWWELSGRDERGISAMLPDILLDDFARRGLYSYRSKGRLDAAERLYEHGAAVIVSSPETALIRPEFQYSRYRLSPTEMQQAEQNAREYLALHPVPPY